MHLSTFLLALLSSLFYAHSALARKDGYLFADYAAVQQMRETRSLIARSQSANDTSGQNYFVEFKHNYTYPALATDLSASNISHTLLSLFEPPGPWYVIRGAAVTLSPSTAAPSVSRYAGVKNMWAVEQVPSIGIGFHTFGVLLGAKVT
ncbi:hypothetical protein BU26DRAFT_137035 [Trematosphaeria pertusa]|uniref:Uncharacterized protein n=1 Tax=Trematosphaeria pertusa TaxID=390896 RepID=A0A6A6IUX5_9PLEO|nr:uncharacterized protein BU26DRAFT_137035 [Trematosphaeria pertusa]KAF2254361.1 hypothetical protein BU26DRAFT_137035 [Trematosphaeria pertusa]